MDWLKRNIGWLGLGVLLFGSLFAWVESSFNESVQMLRSLPGIGSLLLLVAGVLLTLHLVWNWSRVRLFSKARASRYGTNAILYTFAVAGILAVLNVLVARHDLRWDATTEGFHSLAPQSRQLLESIETPVQALAFLGENHGGRQSAEDLLSLMEHAGKGKLGYEFIDPILQPDRAKEYGVSSHTEVVFVSENEQSRVTEITESAFVNGILEATRESRPTVCMSVGHGERRLDSREQMGYAIVAQALDRERYTVVDVNLQRSDSLRGICDVLVIAGPSRPLQQGEVGAIAKFLESGGGVFALLEPEIETGLEELLRAHGAHLTQDQVVEARPLKDFGYLNPIGITYSDHPIVLPLLRGRVNTIFHNARSVEIGEKISFLPELDGKCLVKTGARNSYAESEPGLIDLQPDENTGDRLGPICLGVATTLDPKKIPVESGTEPPPPGPVRRLVVFGDADYVTNLFSGIGGNLDLFLNSVAWLSRRGDHLEIREPDRRTRTVLLSEGQVRLIQAVTLYGLPGVILVGGILIWFYRRRL